MERTGYASCLLITVLIYDKYLIIAFETGAFGTDVILLQVSETKITFITNLDTFWGVETSLSW